MEVMAEYYDIIECSDEAIKIRESANIVRMQSAKRRRDNIAYVSLYDDQNLIMIVDLEKRNRGTIIWHSDSQLCADLRISINTNIDELIALPTARHHKQNLMKIDTYRYDFRLLEKTNNVFIRDRYGFVVYVTVKMNLVNNPNLAMLVSIRKVDEIGDYAILDLGC